MTELVVNGCAERARDGGRTLLSFVREDLGLAGAKPGCGEGSCGACTVLVDGRPALACRTTVDQVAGRSVTTVEGLAARGELHPVQAALADESAFQCGYCAPAMVLRSAALLSGLAADESTGCAAPDPEEIMASLEPNLCRCGCYPRIVRAVQRAAGLLAGGSPGTGTGVPAGGAAGTPFAAGALPRPARPWDRCDPSEVAWFDVLGDGLVAVWPVSQPGGGANGGAWLHVAPSGSVLAFSGKVDVGQDNTTAFRLLVAEELGVEPERVGMVLGDTDLCPFDVGTFGSRSMPDAGEPLRRAAAGARQALVSVAAARWGVGLGDVGTAGGSAVRRASGERVSFGELVGGLRRLELLGREPLLLDRTAWRVAGRPGHGQPQLDAVTGTRRFISDLELPGMLHGALLRPGAPGASLRTVDIRPAERVPGAAVVRDGELVGAVASDPVTARRAVAAMVPDWVPPPPGPSDMPSHLRSHPATAAGWERPLDDEVGDVQAALAGATTGLEQAYTTAFLAHVPLETRAAVAEWAGGRLTVWTGTQVPFGVRALLARELGLDQDDVRVLVPPTGGGFGGKHRGEVAVEAARLARAAGRPVKVHWTRAEEFRFGYVRPMAVVDVRAGLDADGSLAAWDLVDVNAGAAGIGFPYRVANLRLRYRPAESPVDQGSYRALAATANHFAREVALDELASAVGADPLAFRLRHLADARLAAVLRLAAERFGWPRSVGGSGRGSGVAVGLEKGGRVATCADVVVVDGQVRVAGIVTAYECGAVVNPVTVVSQVEGATVMALGGTLFEQVELEEGRAPQPYLARYRVPRFDDVPPVEVVLVDRPDLPSAGAGETPLVAVAPAVANAVFSATGRRLRSLPLFGGSPPAL